ncbi:GNAT family N-acetyltransferase [Spirosoma aureum]|uniref:GNAT family N-acetyltransferase n=1 Tax=Spirosoma aureum TaxID=2692134 RepID=A0A6G9ATG1_9BACT|nr:GNAT family protein [Spirosoma aureum]QIP15761.1 GNAT family N-acetyltransferase [Spirosoma aureum]
MLAINFTPFPELTTNRLILRQMKREDETDFFALRSNPEIMRFIPRPIAQSIADAFQLIQSINDGIRKNESITWGITLHHNPTVIGTIGYVRMAKEHHRAEVGYLLSADFRGQGIMQEALSAVVDYGFQQMKLHSIEGIVDPQNTASASVLEKAGFQKEAHFKENQFYKGQFHDSIHYSRLTPLV